MKDYRQQQQEQLVSLDPEERFYGIMGRFQTRLVAAIEEFQRAVGIESPAPWMDDNRALAILEVSQPEREYVMFSMPATPWQFFKQEYFPAFGLRWFPVRCIEQRVSIKPWEPLAKGTVAQWRAYVAEQVKKDRESGEGTKNGR